jgi:hypothetical protein
MFMCLLVSAQSKGTSQEPSKAAYAERAKKEKPKAMKMSNDKNNKKTKAEMQEPSEAAYAERAKKEKPKAMKVNNAKVVQQDKKVVVNEQPNEQPQQFKAGWQQSVAQKVRSNKDSQPVQQNEEKKGNNEQPQQSKDNWQQSMAQKYLSNKNGIEDAMKPSHVNKNIKEMTEEETSQELKNIQEVRKSRQRANQVESQNKQAKENDSQKFGKLDPYFWPKKAQTPDDKESSELGDYDFTQNSKDVEKLNNTLAGLKVQEDKRRAYEKMFSAEGFATNSPEVNNACDEWKKAKENAEIFSKYKEKIDGLSKIHKDENSLRQAAKKDPELSQYVQKIENYEKENVKNYSVKNTVDDRYSKAQADAKKKWDILIDKFENCKDCKTK